MISACKGAETSLPPIAEKGIINLEQWEFEDADPVRLDGEWAFYHEKLWTPVDFKKQEMIDPVPAQWIYVPKTWNRQSEPYPNYDGKGL